MKSLIIFLMTVTLTLGLTAQTSVSVLRDTRGFNTAQVAGGGEITRGFTLSGFTSLYATPENADFSQLYSRWSVSHTLPTGWLGLGGLSAFAKREDCINYAQASQWRFGLSLENDISVLGNQGWLLLCVSPINLVERGLQFNANYNLPIFGAFAASGFIDLSLVDGKSIWRLEPMITANLEERFDFAVKYVKSQYIDNSDSWQFGGRFSF